LVSIDFFTVPTARFRVLFVFVLLAHHRRRVVHFNVTEHPTARWTAQQIVDAFPNDSAPSYLLRDRDQVYGEQFRHRVKVCLPFIRAIGSRRPPEVFVMEPTDAWHLHDNALARPLYTPRLR
jgi:hypothetical protein